MKAIRSNRKITPFGGAIPVLKQIKAFKIPELIRECLGTRVKQAKYGYDDVIIAWMLTNLCGGMRLDHITKLRRSLDIIPGLKLPSHDTLGRVMKSLATEITTTEHVHRGKIKNQKEAKRKGRKTYEIITYRETNENDPLNELLVKCTKKMGLLKENKSYTLDMDATLIPTKCFSAKKNYKKQYGHQPMVSCIDKLPVYIGMRNGNVSPGAEIKECLEKTIGFLEKSKIKVDKVRLDGGSYSKNGFQFLDEKEIKFYSGIVSSKVIMDKIEAINSWKQFSLETSTVFWECEAGCFTHTLFKSEKPYRYVVLRVLKKNSYKAPSHWTSGNGKYAYKIIVTNDLTSSEYDIVKFYNNRGTAERNFDDLKNNFAWRLPPFCEMNQNTVFIIISALTSNVYQGLLQMFSKKIPELRLNARLREFIYIFMSVACELTDVEYVFYDTDIAYEKIC
jgi:hypothetical protein